jgi:hypothetical protein
MCVNVEGNSNSKAKYTRALWLQLEVGGPAQWCPHHAGCIAHTSIWRTHDQSLGKHYAMKTGGGSGGIFPCIHNLTSQTATLTGQGRAGLDAVGRELFESVGKMNPDCSASPSCGLIAIPTELFRLLLILQLLCGGLSWYSYGAIRRQ